MLTNMPQFDCRKQKCTHEKLTFIYKIISLQIYNLCILPSAKLQFITTSPRTFAKQQLGTPN